MGCSCPGGTTAVAVDSFERTLSLEHPGGGQNFHKQYVLGVKLGSGAFGAVYSTTRVNPEHSGKELAVKIIDMRRHSDKVAGKFECLLEGNDPRRTRSLSNEVKMLRRVGGCAHVCALLDGFSNGCFGYVVLEICDRPLYKALDRNPMLNEIALRPIIQGMLLGLSFVHFKCVVHRDIKPDNFMCSGPKDTVKLCDFGLACAVSSPTAVECEGVYGTAPFMCPEMLLSAPYGPKSDVWSLGVIVYVLHFGRFPYHPIQQTSHNMKAAIASDVAKPAFCPKDQTSSGAASRDLLKLSRQLLTRDPVVRPTAVQALDFDYFSSEDLSTSSLRTMFHSAKRCGAFEVPQTNKRSGPSDVERHLCRLQEQHLPRMAHAGKVTHHCSDESTETGSVPDPESNPSSVSGVRVNI